MKKYLKNTLIKSVKKSKLNIFIYTLLLIAGIGTLTACAANEADNASLVEENINNTIEENINSAVKESSSNTVEVPDIVLEKAEELVADWYLTYKETLPDYYFSDWRIESLAHCYTYEDFDNMTLQVYQLNYEYLSDKPENVILAGATEVTEDGWVAFNPNSTFLIYEKKDEELSFLLVMSENDCYPGDEVFSNDLKNELADTVGIPIEDSDIVEINSIIEEFAKAYFEGDSDTLQKFLTSSFEWDVEIYKGGTVGEYKIKGLPNVGDRNANNKFTVSLEFKDSDDDSCTYLTISFVKQEDDWKVYFYGLEK